MSKTWKHAERQVARLLGGKRNSHHSLGRSAPDVVTEWCAVEVKTRKRLPLWIKDGLRQAAAGAGDGKLPILVLHELGSRYEDSLVVLKLSDFRSWFGDLLGEGDPVAEQKP